MLRLRRVDRKDKVPMWEDTNGGDLGNYFQKDLDQLNMMGVDYEIVDGYQPPVSGIAELDDLLKDAKDDNEARGYIDLFREEAVSKQEAAKQLMMEALESTPTTAASADDALVRFAGDYVNDKGFDALMKRAESAVAAEDAGYLNIDESKGLSGYGEKEALSEQSARIKAADKERYGDELPFLVSKTEDYTTAEQKRNKAIFEGRRPVDAPYDSIKGSAVRKKEGRLGIQGDFMPNSEVRVHTQYGTEIDPLTDTPMIERLPVMTEFMTDSDARQLYSDWVRSVEADNRSGRNRFTQQTDIGSFNRFLAEYYGQQGLKLRGMQPVADSQRSKAVKEAAQGGKATSLGTDRLLEMSRSMLDPEVRPLKDYRYLDQNGKLIVGDSQTLPNRDASNDYGLEILNASRMSPTQERNFERNLAKVVYDLRSQNPQSTIEDALIFMSNHEMLPGFSEKVLQGEDRFVKVGKALSGQPKLGTGGISPNDYFHQAGAQEIVYSTLPNNFERVPGVTPAGMTLVNLSKLNQVLGDPAITNELTVSHYPYHQRYQKGKVRIDVPQDVLISEGVAERLISPELMRQLRK